MDELRKKSDKELKKIEDEIERIYKDAEDDLKDKWDKYMSRAEKRVEGAEKALQDAMKTGDADAIATAKAALTQKKQAVFFRDKQFSEMVDAVTDRIANVNQLAADYVNGQMPAMYRYNYNGSLREVQKDAEASGISGIAFNMIDDATVARMQKRGEVTLPKRKIDVPKDKQWNKKALNSQIMQGIIQGESIPQMSKRLREVTDMNKTSSIRNARTMTTEAENGGRLDSMKEAEELGLEYEKTWLASHDDRTRLSHALLDGETVGLDEPFSNGLQYPADPSGPPEEVYNCRCSLVRKLVGFKGKHIETKGYEPTYFDDVKAEAPAEEDAAERELQQRRDAIKEQAEERFFGGSAKEATKNAVLDTIDNMDAQRLQIMEATANNLHTRWIDAEGTSHYTVHSGQIEMYNMKHGERSGEEAALTFWHEYGHYADDARTSGSGYSRTVTMSNGSEYTLNGIGVEAGPAFYDAAEADMNAFLERMGLSDEYECRRGEYGEQPWIFHKDGTGVDPQNMTFEDQKALNDALIKWQHEESGYYEARDYLYSMGKPREPEYTDYMEMYRTPKRGDIKWREKYEGAQEDYYKESQRVSEELEKWVETHDYEALAKKQEEMYEEARRLERKFALATDTFDGGALGTFMSAVTGGHTASYYGRNDNGRNEAVANVFATVMTQDEEVERGMKSLCPNVYNTLKGVILHDRQ